MNEPSDHERISQAESYARDFYRLTPQVALVPGVASWVHNLLSTQAPGPSLLLPSAALLACCFVSACIIFARLSEVRPYPFTYNAVQAVFHAVLRKRLIWICAATAVGTLLGWLMRTH